MYNIKKDMRFFYIIIFLLLIIVVKAENNVPPKVITQQFDNWSFKCVENKDNKDCEVSQSIRIQNTNINFSIIYSKFLNPNNEIKKQITIISPHGVDLRSELLLTFDQDESIKLNWASCESFGCLVFLTDNTKDIQALNDFKKILSKIINNKKLFATFKGYANQQPFNIEFNLAGFKESSSQLDKININNQ
tara:strand:+ start:20 stop:592 length:573 start_codon:yes stop_codon:yes gene_type:complete